MLLLAIAYGPGLAAGKIILPADMLDAFAPWAATSTMDRPLNPLLGDQIQQMYPWRVFIHQELAAGRFPLWNPYVGAGSPLFSNGQSAVLFPLNLVVLWLSPEIAATLVQLAKPPLAAIGMALFLRALSVRGIAGILAGIAWAFSGPMVAWLGWPHTNALLMVPFLFWAATRWIQRPSLRWWGLNAALLAVQLLGGHPETTAHTVVLLGIYGVALRVQLDLNEPGGGVSFPRRALRTIGVLVGWGGSVPFGAALAGIQVVPLIASIADSVTAAERGISGLANVVLDTETLLTWIVPSFFGTPLAMTFGTLNFLNYNETVGYVGIGVVALAITSVLAPRRLGWIGLALLTLIAFAMAYGIPVLTELRRVPGLNYAANTRFVYFGALGLACLAGMGLDLCLREHGRRTRFVVIGVVSVICVGCAALAAMPGLLQPSVVGAAPLTPVEAAAWRRLELAKAVGIAMLWICAFAVLLLRPKAARNQPKAVGAPAGIRRLALSSTAGGALVVAALSVDLLVFGARYNPMMSPELLTRVPSSIDYIRQADPNGRLIGLAETLLPNTAMLFGLSDFRAYEPVADHHMLKYFERMDDKLLGDIRSRFYLFLWEPRVSMLSVAGVRWVIAPMGDDRTATTTALAAGGLIHRFTGDGTEVWENPAARPRAYVADSVATVPDASRALEWVVQHGADPRAASTVVVDEGLPSYVCVSTSDCSALGTSVSATVREASFLPGRSLARVLAPRGGLLVVNDVLYPGWVATVDGETVPIYRANYLFMGVPVPPGEHAVTLEYRPPAVALGGMLSFAGLALIGLAFAVAGLRVRLPSPAPSQPSGEPELIG